MLPWHYAVSRVVSICEQTVVGEQEVECGEIQLEDGTARCFAHGFPALSSSLNRSDDDPQNRSCFLWSAFILGFSQSKYTCFRTFCPGL
jgi:hypothetical protein